MNKLKPCPFCGGRPKIKTYKEQGWHFSPCCKMIEAGLLYKTKAEAIAAWNTRPDQPKAGGYSCPDPDGCKAVKDVAVMANTIEQLNEERRRDALDGQAELDESDTMILQLQARVKELEAELERLKEKMIRILDMSGVRNRCECGRLTGLGAIHCCAEQALKEKPK